MSTTRALVILLVSLSFTCVIPVVFTGYNEVCSSEAGSEQSTEFRNKVDTSKLSGIEYLIADMYNNDRVLYAVVVTLVMATLGTGMAFLTDLVLKALGLEVSRISHKE